MALHGQLKVNGTTIGTWSAQRCDIEISDTNTYRCHLETDGGTQHFTVQHRYDDGAAALAAKVLGWKPYPDNHPLAQEG